MGTHKAMYSFGNGCAFPFSKGKEKKRNNCSFYVLPMIQSYCEIDTTRKRQGRVYDVVQTAKKREYAYTVLLIFSLPFFNVLAPALKCKCGFTLIFLTL